MLIVTVMFLDMRGKRDGNITVTRIVTLGECINVRICNYYVNRDYYRATLFRNGTRVLGAICR